MKSFLLLAFTLQLASCCVSADKSLEEDDDEERLMNLMLSQNKYRRPVLSAKDNVTVTLGITLHQIVDVVEKHQILKLSLFIRQKWTSPLLRWNLSDYGGITEINVDPSFLWKPDIYLYNNAAEDKDGAQDKMRTNIQVDHNGTIKWLAPTILQSSCKINVQYFPFDEQTCDLKFGSWTYDARRVDLVAESSSADLRGFQVNGEWDLVEFPCQRNVELYKCCPHPYSDITCKLKIRRRTTFFFVNLIVPCFLVTLLSLLSFFLPSEAGERITLVITNLLALTVFMLLVADILPQTSEVVPLISIYFTSVLIEVSLSLTATCIVLKCYFGNPTISEVPLWVRCVVMRGIAKLVRIKVKPNRREEQRNDKITDNDKKSNRPMSFSESLDRNCNRCHHRLTKDQWPEAALGMLDDYLNVRSCGVCRERNLELLHLTNGLNSRLISRCQSKNSLKRDSWLSDVCPPNENNLNADTQSQTSLISALLHQQEHLVQHVYKLVKAVQKQEQHDNKREDWVLVAEILDTFFFYVFIVLTICSTFFIFAIGTRW